MNQTKPNPGDKDCSGRANMQPSLFVWVGSRAEGNVRQVPLGLRWTGQLTAAEINSRTRKSQ